MRILKGFALGLLGLILFVSLSVFGLSMTLNVTVLNPDFVVSQINKVDTTSLAKDFLNGMGNGNGLPEGINTQLVSTITSSDTQIKRQVASAVYPVYDYIRGDSPDIDLADTLSKTLLQRDFVASLINGLDISSLLKSFTDKQLNNTSVPLIGNKSLVDYVNDAITKSEPQIKQQLSTAIGPVMDYVLGKSQTLQAQISLAPVLDDLKVSIKQDLLKSPPPEFAGLPSAELSQALDGYINDIAGNVPTTININESMVADFKVQIANTLASVKDMLAQARQYVGYVLLAFRVSLALLILSIAGIILINRQVKASARAIGITFVVYGALEFAGIIVARAVAIPQLAGSIPAQLQAPIMGLIGDVVSPLQIFSLVILGVGIVLIVVSAVYKPRKKEFQGT